MTVEILVKKSGVSRATLYRLLQGVQDTPAIHKVAAVAEALGVKATFAPVATAYQVKVVFSAADVDKLLKQQAKRQAKRLVGMVQGTMGLESQAVKMEQAARMIETTYIRLMSGPKKRLWRV